MLAEIRTVLIATVVSAIVGGAISLGFQSYSANVQHERTVKLEAALTFTSADSEVIPVASRFIQAVNGGEDLEPVRAELRSKLANEIARTQSLYETFESLDAVITGYQSALGEFARTLDAAVSPTTMRPWAESFGRVVDARQELDAQLTRAARA